MSNIITYDYFINDVNIPYSDSTMKTRLTNAITRFEEECLRALFGDKLYDAFITGLAVTPTPDAKWTNLRDGGVTFNILLNGETIQKTWKGLNGGTSKKSLIAYYVYCKFRNANETFFTGVNQAKGSSENTEVAEYKPIISERWNQFVRMYGQIPYDVFTATPFAPVADTFYYDEASAYNFLMANITTYTDWRFTAKDLINEYGI